MLPRQHFNCIELHNSKILAKSCCAWKQTLCVRGRLPWGQEGQLPHLPSSIRLGGARIALHAELISFRLSCKGAFPAFQTVWFEKIFLGESPQTPNVPWYSPQTPNVPCYSYETSILDIDEFEDQNLLLWRNIHIHRCAFRGSLVSLT